jgi:hypothetical protein
VLQKNLKKRNRSARKTQQRLEPKKMIGEAPKYLSIKLTKIRKPLLLE